MGGNSFGKIFRISTFGESHGVALGVIVDGCPAGLPLSEEDIQRYLERRRPGKNLKMTARKEGDRVEILSGVFEGYSTGTAIALLVRNEDQRSKDYSAIKECFRPGHADYGFFSKYGFRDYRGGGRSSGRETVSRVAAGAIAKKILEELEIQVEARVVELCGIKLSGEKEKEEADARLLQLREEGDSAGGIVECRVNGLCPGIGEPVFDKLDARLAEAIMSIGAVKAVEIGDGLLATKRRGSENNDPFIPGEGEAFPLRKESNHSGGILGGMSDGAEIIVRAGFKPTPSISREQKTVRENGEPTTIVIKGRHDPTVVERATVVVEAMTAIVVLDCLLENMSAKLENVKKIYRK